MAAAGRLCLVVDQPAADRLVVGRLAVDPQVADRRASVSMADVALAAGHQSMQSVSSLPPVAVAGTRVQVVVSVRSTLVCWLQPVPVWVPLRSESTWLAAAAAIA